MAHNKTHTHTYTETDGQTVADRHKQSTTDTEHKTRINDNKQVEYEETEKQTEQGVSRLALGEAKGCERDAKGT